MEDALKAFEAKGLERSEFFDYLKEDQNVYALRGTFYNCGNCNIQVIPTLNNKNIVGIIGISLPKQDTFKDLKNQYDDLKAALSEKYHMVSSTESFDDESVGEGTFDELKLMAISRNEAKFTTEFHLSENKEDDMLGYIRLFIHSTKVKDNDSFFVSIIYCTYDCIMEQAHASDDL